MMEEVSLQSDEAFLPNAFSQCKNRDNIFSITWLLQCLFFWTLALLALKAEQVPHEIPTSLGP